MISMNIIYLDTLFLVNFICDYILLLCTARVGGTVIRRTPILLSAILGGVYACLCCLPHCTWMNHPLVKCAGSLLLCLISFGSEHHLYRCAVIFLCVSAMAGGLLSAVSIPYGSIHYVPIHLKSILLAFAVIYYLLSMYFRNCKQMHSRRFHNVTVTLHGKSVSFRALRDSGNELCDPITNRPVLICTPSALNELFPVCPNWDSDPLELFCQLNTATECANRMLLIPCHTVTGSGLLLGIKADEVTVDGHPEPYIVAVSKERFQSQSTYQAIL